MQGLRTASLYGIKPHQLGFCGPQEGSATQYLVKYLSGQKVSERKIRKILEGFEGAFAYYKLIAKNNNVRDPFDERAVKAYWIGNNFLDNVSVQNLRKMIKNEFSKPGLLSKNTAEKRAREIPSFSKPHHSFHVLVIGSVTNRIKLKGNLLDFCRISWGQVMELDPLKGKIKIKYKPLLTQKKYKLGKPKEKYISWNKNLLPQLRVGAVVSAHWNQAIQVLAKEDQENLRKYTQKTLNAINSKI